MQINRAYLIKVIKTAIISLEREENFHRFNENSKKQAYCKEAKAFFIHLLKELKENSKIIELNEV